MTAGDDVRPGSEVANERALREWEFRELKDGACVWPEDTPLEVTTLMTKTMNYLKRDGRHTVGDVLARTCGQLLDIRNFGPAHLAEVCRALTSAERAIDDGESGRVMYRLRRAVELIEEYEDFLPEEFRVRLRTIIDR